jgi:pilus assembly protein CpaE
MTPRHTLGELLRTADSLDREMLSQSLTPHHSGVSILAGGLSSDEFDSVPPQDVDRLFQVARASLPCCVVDLDRRAAKKQRLLESADSIVLAFRLDFASLCNTRRILNEWKQRQLELTRVTLVANRGGLPSEIPLSKAGSILGRPVDASLPDDAAASNLSINCGTPVLIEDPKCRLSQQLTALADRLVPSPSSMAVNPERPGSLNPSGSLIRRAANALFC